MRGLYAITPDLQDSALLLHKAQQALQGGASFLQYRNKLATEKLAREQALALRKLTHRYHAKLIVNDFLALALEVDADGLHLGGDDGDLAQARAQLPEGKWLGASCYNDLDLAQQALQQGASYIAFGAVFASGTKPQARRASPELISLARKQFTAPIVAIGGITLDNAEQVLTAGADCLAVIGALFDCDDIEARARQFSHLF